MDEKKIIYEGWSADMAGDETEQDQKIIIEHDKGYEHFITNRILMDYFFKISGLRLKRSIGNQGNRKEGNFGGLAE